MRVFLVVSVALIGLFADQSSLFATLVYQYELSLQTRCRHFLMRCIASWI